MGHLKNDVVVRMSGKALLFKKTEYFGKTEMDNHKCIMPPEVKKGKKGHWFSDVCFSMLVMSFVDSTLNLTGNWFASDASYSPCVWLLGKQVTDNPHV